MPKPIPQALVAHALGSVPKAALIGLAVLAHLGYGATAGAGDGAATGHRGHGHRVRRGAVGVVGLAWLPYLGWGLFGTGITAKIAAATVLLHLVYGTTLGLLLDRGRAR